MQEVIAFHVLQIAIYAPLKHNALLVSQIITYLLMVLAFLHVLLHLFLIVQLNLVIVVLIVQYHQEKIHVIAIMAILMLQAIVNYVLQIVLIVPHKILVRYAPQDITYFQMELVLIHVHLLLQMIILINIALVVLIVNFKQIHVLAILVTQIQEVIACHVDQIVINVPHKQHALYVLMGISCLQMELVFLIALLHSLWILLIRNVSAVVIALFKTKLVLVMFNIQMFQVFANSAHLIVINALHKQFVKFVPLDFTQQQIIPVFHSALLHLSKIQQILNVFVALIVPYKIKYVLVYHQDLQI
ncbi:transmembrane protein, putative (macronuclear) [Tetrahymena thermophila SB210]|uniref:Transmembrane protein, putative n=1 Tax=Tetrahymena thermophila (strain SB210) TaxID=312017 RepID=W7WX66_TETTS|nr:transmembrane protein, putative [Tetrahymena thermophila SB210]EWS71405.1 transmembrane protein, putative [Tetrahymena thermophila SB210]|eukprot:XP_012656057.1 transmembrane protein, putative [Tetrahymena thermophila SB210]